MLARSRALKDDTPVFETPPLLPCAPQGASTEGGVHSHGTDPLGSTGFRLRQGWRKEVTPPLLRTSFLEVLKQKPYFFFPVAEKQ